MNDRVMRDRRNHVDSKTRSDNGRMGRGDNALASKETAWWRSTLVRIEGVVANAQSEGKTLQFKIHAYQVSARARKF